MCIDIKGFTQQCAEMSAGATGEWVADFYARVDCAAAACGMRRAESRGDCCICVAEDEDEDVSAPSPACTQARRALTFATAVHALLSGAAACRCSSSDSHVDGIIGDGCRPISARMGIATGAVLFLEGGPAAGFAGVQGGAVEAATRMEALSQPGVAVVHETATEQWATETGRRPPRTACCRAGRGGGAGVGVLERAAAYDCAAEEFAAGPGEEGLLREAGLRSLGRGEWPALLRRRSSLRLAEELHPAFLAAVRPGRAWAAAERHCGIGTAAVGLKRSVECLLPAMPWLCSSTIENVL